MNDQNAFLISILISTVAVIISCMGLIISRKQMYNEIIGKNRIEHNKEIRNIVFRFVQLYVSNSSFEELLVVKLHVDLCLNLNKKSNK
ncbi:MAG: hypothetical protein LBM02_03645, partial [Lachnospiraceae bacterium]|nr:hypothetical protein [Lachnospiraceae bacterium]